MPRARGIDLIDVARPIAWLGKVIGSRRRAIADRRRSVRCIEGHVRHQAVSEQ
jgi:hypothetical protein